MIIKEYQCPILGFFLNLRYGFLIDPRCVVGSIIEKGIVEILTVQELPQFFEKERILLPLVRGISAFLNPGYNTAQLFSEPFDQ